VRPSLEMIAALGCFACLGLGVALDYPPLFMASALLGPPPGPSARGGCDPQGVEKTL